MQLVSELVAKNARWYPDKPAAIDLGCGLRLTWAEVHERTSRMANALLGLGLQKGDRIVIIMNNSVYFWEPYFICAKSGIIGSTLNLRLHPKEMANYLNYIKPRAIICGPEFAELSKGLKENVPSVEFIIGAYGEHKLELDYESLLKQGGSEPPKVIVTENDPYYLVPTSGTTGIPKACIYTQKMSMTSTLTWLAQELGLNSDSRYYLLPPMFFGTAGPGAFLHALKGGAAVMYPTFDPENFMKIIQEEKITHVTAATAVLNMIVNHPNANNYDMSSIKCIFIGGSGINVEFVKKTVGIFGNVLRTNYGGMEWSSGANILDPDEMIIDGPPEKQKRLSSAGRPNAGVDVKIVDDNGNEVPHGESGEVCVKGDIVSRGYWEMPEETENSFRDGWFHTGDIGMIDPDYYLYIVDRKKDMIKSGGISVFSVEIEKIIADYPGVMQAAVIGVPDKHWGEAIKALIVLRPGAVISEEDIIAHCRDNLAAFKAPKTVEFLTELPMNASGKILKRVLREQYALKA